MDFEEIEKVSKPVVHRLTANLDAIKDTCDIMSDLIHDTDWNLAFRATACITMIEMVTGVTCETKRFLDFLDSEAKRQLKGDSSDD
jgi:hypothetical protein